MKPAGNVLDPLLRSVGYSELFAKYAVELTDIVKNYNELGGSPVN